MSKNSNSNIVMPADDSSSTAYNVLQVLMHEKEFGFVLDKNGVIESACGNSENLLGVSNSYLISQSIVRFIALHDRQKVLSILPSGNYSQTHQKSLTSKHTAPQKIITCEFVCQRTGNKTKLEVTASLIVTNMNDSSVNFSERSCAHVVCVTHRPSSDSESVAGMKAESLSKPACIVLVLGVDRKVQFVELREKLDGVDEKNFLSKSIFELCPRSERPVLETLLDAVTQCSAELKLCVNNRSLNVNATAIRHSGRDQIRLECKLVDRVSFHNVEQQPMNQSSSAYTFEAISPASSTSRDVPHDTVDAPKNCALVLHENYDTKPYTMMENQMTIGQPSGGGTLIDQPINNFNYFAEPGSSSYDFDEKDESPAAKKKRRPSSKVKIKASNDTKPTSPNLFSPNTEMPKPKNPTMLQTLLTSSMPCIGYNMGQPARTTSSFYPVHEVQQKFMVEQPKQKAAKNSRGKKKELANGSSTPTNSSTPSVGFPIGSLPSHQSNMFQTSMASVPMGGGMAAYVMTGPGLMQNGTQMNGGVVYNPHNMPIASTSSSVGCNLPINQQGSSGFSVASTPLQLQTHHSTNNMSTSSYGHMNHTNMGAMSHQGIVNCNPMGNVANMHSMPGPMNNSMSSPQMMNPQQWGQQNPNAMQSNTGYSNQLGQNYSMLPQNSAQNGMLGSPNSNLAAQKKNILKRKNMMQPPQQVQQQFMMDQQPPNKQPFMGSTHPDMMPNQYMQQNPAGPMYQMSQQQKGTVQGSSPQFSSTSPMNNHNHLSPYGNYDAGNGGPAQWNKRPPSRGDIVRMELRHSVQARQATSPNPPNGMISANDIGMPRFPAPNAISPSNMMLSPQRMGHQDAQQQQSYSTPILNAIPQTFPSDQQKTIQLHQDTNSQPLQFSSATINTLPTVSLEDCRAILDCEFDLCNNDLGSLDFSLCNGQFDIDKFLSTLVP